MAATTENSATRQATAGNKGAERGHRGTVAAERGYGDGGGDGGKKGCRKGSTGQTPAELGDGDGGGDGGVEGLGAGVVGRVGRDEEAVGDQGLHTGGDAVGFVADDDSDGLGEARIQLAGVHVHAVQEGAVDLAVLLQDSRGKRLNINIVEIHSEDSSHGGLDDLGIEGLDGVAAGQDRPDAEPVGDAEDGPEVAGVTDGVQREIESRTDGERAVVDVRRLADDGEDRGGTRELADARHGLLADLVAAVHRRNLEARVQRLLHHLFTFHDEQTGLVAEFLGGKRLDGLDVPVGKLGHVLRHTM